MTAVVNHLSIEQENNQNDVPVQTNATSYLGSMLKLELVEISPRIAEVWVEFNSSVGKKNFLDDVSERKQTT